MGKSFIGGVNDRNMNKMNIEPSMKLEPARTVFFLHPSHLIKAEQGSTVSVGDILAIGNGNTPDILSGISGEVKIEGEARTVTVENDGKNTLCSDCVPFSENINEIDIDRIVGRLHRMGIDLPELEAGAQCLVVSLCEDDTYSSAQYSCGWENTDELVGGAAIIMKCLGIANAVFAIPSPYRDLMREVKKAIIDGKMMRAEYVSGKYPQYYPQMLISTLFDFEISLQKDTEKAGYPVISGSLCVAVYKALAEGIPYTSSYVTVSGKDATYKGNYIVPFGSQISELAEISEADTQKSGRVILGGTMKGKNTELTAHTDRETRTVLFLRKGEMVVGHECIECGKCYDVCPAMLIPSLIYDSVSRGEGRDIEKDSVHCIGCGCCNYVCPSGIDIRGAVLGVKNKIKNEETKERVGEKA